MRTVVWYLGTIQYCACLFGGGALWFLAAVGTGFFWDNLAAQITACGLLAALIGAESWWARMTPAGNPVGDFLVDLLSSAAIAGFGMAVVLGILATLHR